MNATRDTIVVGVDGSTHALAAVDWAAERAHRLGRALELVHGYTVQFPDGIMDPAMTGPPAPDWIPPFLTDACDRVRVTWPDVDVTAVAIPDGGSSSLVSLSRHASLVVVGAHGRSFVSRLLLGSVSRHVTAHAHCPAVVVRGVPKPGSWPVAVGIDDSPTAQSALAWAFAEAASRDVGLTVFHAWQEVPVTGYGLWATPPGLEDAIEADAEKLLTTSLAPWRDQYPQVEVRERIVRAPPATAVVDQSHHAQLVVLGAHGRGAFRGMTLGSVPASAVHQTDCPVVVVPPVDRMHIVTE